MSKKVAYGQAGREKLKAGIDILADAVKVTLGPKGRNVVIKRDFRAGHVTKDGVTVAKEIELEDPIENMGAQMVKEVASKTADIAGDGTTTATVLAQKIYSEGIRLIQSGSNPIQIKNGMDIAKLSVEKELKELAVLVNSNDRLYSIATVSANNDKLIGSLVGDAFSRVGKNGLVELKEGKTGESFLQFSEGLEIDRGYMSPYFINSPGKEEVDFGESYVLVVYDDIEVMQDILSVIEHCIRENMPLIVIAKDIKDEMLQTLVVNKIQNGLKIAAIKAPGFGETAINLLQDIAIATGAVLVDSNKGIKFTDIDESYLGRCNSINMKSQKSTLIGVGGNKDDINARVDELTIRLSNAKTGFEKDSLINRISKLNGSACTIVIGANSEIELREKRDRYDDAMNAVRSALEEGIIPGGGSALLYISNKLKNLKGSTESENAGIRIVLEAIKEPFKQILLNADIGSEYYIKKLQKMKYGFGLNVKTEKVENLLESGVIDPVKVARLGVENAISIVGTLLTTECIIY